MLELAKIDSTSVMTSLSQELSNNAEFILKLIDIDPCFEVCASIELQSNPDFMLGMAKKKHHVNIPDELLENAQFMLALARIDSNYLFHASTKLSDNPNFIIEAAKISSVCIGRDKVSDRLKNDFNFMLELVKIDPAILWYTGTPLINNASFMLEAIKVNPICIDFVPDQLKNDSHFIVAYQSVEVNRVKQAKPKRDGELSTQDEKLIDCVESLQMQIIDEQKKNALLKSQVKKIGKVSESLSEEELGGIGHGRR